MKKRNYQDFCLLLKIIINTPIAPITANGRPPDLVVGIGVAAVVTVTGMEAAGVDAAVTVVVGSAVGGAVVPMFTWL